MCLITELLFHYIFIFDSHKKNLFRENPGSSTNVYKLWFWKKKQKQYSTWVRVPDLLISFTRLPGKVDEVLHVDTANTFRIPIHMQQRAEQYVPCESVWGQGQWLVRAPGEAGNWLWQWRYKPPIPALTWLSDAGPLSPMNISKLSTGGEDTSPMVDLGPESTPPPLLFPGLSWKRGNSVVLLTFGCLFTVLCSLLKLHVSANRVSWII